MKKSEELKGKIIEAATELIINSDGDIQKITTRNIAEKANVGVGLINYHFQTKENLIELCVQRIIENVILNFKPSIEENISSTERLKRVAKMVADFLINNEAVSRISILGDMANPKTDDNTTKTMRGFNLALGECKVAENEKSILIFILTSIMQSIFLRKDICFQLFNINFYDKRERDLFLDFLIDRLFVK